MIRRVSMICWVARGASGHSPPWGLLQLANDHRSRLWESPWGRMQIDAKDESGPQMLDHLTPISFATTNTTQLFNRSIKTVLRLGGHTALAKLVNDKGFDA